MQKETLDIAGTDIFRLSVFCCESYRCVWGYSIMIHYITCKIVSRTTISKADNEKQNEINNHAQSAVQIYILHVFI